MALVCPAFFLNRLGKLQRRAFTYIQQLFLLVHNALCLCKDIALACPMKFLEKTLLDFFRCLSDSALSEVMCAMLFSNLHWQYHL